MLPGLRSAWLIVFSAAVFAQSPSLRARLDLNTIPRPAIPANALELVTGAAQPVEDAEQRIAALGLLTRARSLSNLRGQPYDVKTSFSASGGLASDGNWMLEDTAARRKYRWTAQGPNYSAVRVYPGLGPNALYGNQPTGDLPLRLMQARSAIFFLYPMASPYSSVRTATASLNGAEQRCVLIALGIRSRPLSGGRNWEEVEYCVDARTGLLTTYSPAPGLFVRYDYSPGIRFHDKIIPSGFTISEAGQTVLEARTMSVTDPPASDEIFNTAGLMALGAGRDMYTGANAPIIIPMPGKGFSDANTGAAMQIVTLHGNISGNGNLSEVEILASTDASLNWAAIQRASEIAKLRAERQPGATAQSSEWVWTFEFVTAGR